MSNHIQKFWNDQGKTHGTSHYASWGDKFAIELEIETIAKHIKNGDNILDVGCANGYSTFSQFAKQPSAKFTGIDYASEMIKHAAISKKEKNIGNEINFSEGNILNLEFPDNSFDITYTTRVVINLPIWEEQIKAIEECIRVTKKGGKIIFSEGFWEPLCLLNSVRALKNLPPLAEHDFNRYLKKEKLEKLLNDKKLNFINDDFSSIYYLGSRFLREMTDAEKTPWGDYSSPVNEEFYKLEQKFSGGGFGIQQAYIITK